MHTDGAMEREREGRGVGLRYKKDRESRKTQNPMPAMRAQEGWEVKRVSEVKREKRRGERDQFTRGFNQNELTCVFRDAFGVMFCN